MVSRAPDLLSASAAGPTRIKTVWQGAWDRLHPFDGRYQPGNGPEGRSNVHYWFQRLGLQPPISMGRTGGRCCLRKETWPAWHTRRCRPDIEPLDTFYVKDGGPHQAVPRCL